MLQVCLNGPRNAADSGAVPMSPAALAEAARQAVAAGATDLHVHPKTPCGRDSLSPRVVGPALAALRAVVDVPVGVTTGARAEPDPPRRVARIVSWTVLPPPSSRLRSNREVPPSKFSAPLEQRGTPIASVNWHEPGAEAVAAALLERGIGVEAGLWSGTDGPERFAPSPLAPRVLRMLRVLAEVTVTDPDTATATARELLAAVASSGHGRPVLLHGSDGGAWPVLRPARQRGLDTRIGVEGTLLLPDGRPAADNAQLVRAAAAGPGAP
ncbi:3-keto-5-aminohexanoate cleavage protein [Streptomyces lydicus]|uniref:3-keto-5-aminohexanoate cleavage protein n=1 Tax=Streptomyces lydicus TaxID=47763 RepID=UPI0037A92D3F